MASTECTAPSTCAGEHGNGDSGTMGMYTHTASPLRTPAPRRNDATCQTGTNKRATRASARE